MINRYYYKRIIINDLKWNEKIALVVAKASKRLLILFLRVLSRCPSSWHNLNLHVFDTLYFGILLLSLASCYSFLFV